MWRIRRNFVTCGLCLWSFTLKWVYTLNDLDQTIYKSLFKSLRVTYDLNQFLNDLDFSLTLTIIVNHLQRASLQHWSIWESDWDCMHVATICQTNALKDCCYFKETLGHTNSWERLTSCDKMWCAAFRSNFIIVLWFWFKSLDTHRFWVDFKSIFDISFVILI